MPKVSIIVPVYNVEQYLEKCLNSLINQTLTDIEIICVDDCSTDNSYKILKKYAKQDSRITILKNKKNSGQSVSRNIAIDKAKADYIMFCDSDDWFEPTMCEHMLELIIKKHSDLGACSVNVVYEANPNLKNNDQCFCLPDGCFNPHDFRLQKMHNGTPLRIFKKNIIVENDIKFPHGLKYEDVYFSNVYNLYVKKIATTSEKLYNYRRRNGSTTSTTFAGHSHITTDQAKIAIKYFDYLKKHNFYNQEYNNFWTKMFISCVQNSLMFTKDKKNMCELDKILANFITKNYIFGTTDTRTDYIISLILDGTFMRRKKYFFGLFQVYHETNKTEYCIWKICIFKLKHLVNQIKYYLFGVWIYKKDIK